MESLLISRAYDLLGASVVHSLSPVGLILPMYRMIWLIIVLCITALSKLYKLSTLKGCCHFNWRVFITTRCAACAGELISNKITRQVTLAGHVWDDVLFSVWNVSDNAEFIVVYAVANAWDKDKRVSVIFNNSTGLTFTLICLCLHSYPTHSLSFCMRVCVCLRTLKCRKRRDLVAWQLSKVLTLVHTLYFPCVPNKQLHLDSV